MIDINSVNTEISVNNDLPENFIHLFCPDADRLSITIRILNPGTDEPITSASKSLPCYGMPVSFSVTEIKSRLFREPSVFRNADLFHHYVRKWLSMAHYHAITDSREQEAVVAKTILAFAWPYYLEAEADSSCAEEFARYVDDDPYITAAGPGRYHFHILLSEDLLQRYRLIPDSRSQSFQICRREEPGQGPAIPDETVDAFIKCD